MSSAGWPITRFSFTPAPSDVSVPRTRRVMRRSLMACSGSRVTGRQDGPVRAHIQAPAPERIVHQERGVRESTRCVPALPSLLTPFHSLLLSMHPMATALARRRGLTLAGRVVLQHHGFHFRLGGGFGLPVLVDREQHRRHLAQAVVVLV